MAGTAIALLSLTFGMTVGILSGLIRAVRRGVQIEDRIGELTTALFELSKHMRHEREAMDRRVRFMEEYFMRHSMGKGEGR